VHPENAGTLDYVLFSGLSLGTAMLLLRYMRRPDEKDIRMTALPVMVLGAIIGAKLPVLLSYGIRKEMIYTGKSYFGALVGAFVAVNIYKAAKNLKAAYGDRFVVPLCVAAGMGKIGCFIYGCCGGTETDFVLKVKNKLGIYVHPVQLYEASFEFICAGLFLYLYKTEQLKGLHFLLYLAAYSVFRFCIEFTRIEPRVFAGLTVYQMMSVLVVPILVLMYNRRLHEPVSVF